MKPDFDERDAHESGDTLPDQAGVYVAPRPVPALSDHRTMDVKAIRIAAEHDPRQALTQLRMQAPPRRRRRLPLVALGIFALGTGLAVGAYLELKPDEPLPLVSSTAEVPAPVLTATVAPDEAAPAVPPPAAPPVAAAAPTATAAPASEPGETSVPAPPVEPPVAKARVPRGKTATPAAHPRRSAPASTQVGRDPWLE